MVDIGPRIGIDGEKEYRDEINRIIQQAKTLDSEMKMVAASFTDATTEEEKNAKTAAVLEKRIKAQKDKIKALSDMLERSKEKTGESSTQTLKWQQALNDAKAELSKLENSTKKQTEKTEDLSDAMKDSGKEATSFGTILKANLASDLIMKGLEKVVDITKKIVSTAADAVKGVGKIFVGNAKWADDLLTLSQNTGISTDRLQEFEYMAERIDTDLDTITDAMARNIRSMKSTTETTETATDADKEYAEIQEEIIRLTEEVSEARTEAAKMAEESSARAAEVQKELQAATFEVERAQIAYNDAVKKAGKNSAEAKAAESDLKAASDNLTRAQTAYNEALAIGQQAAENLLIKQTALSDAQSRLANLQKGGAESVNAMTEAYQKLGVTVYDSVTGELRDSEQVFFEVIDALGKIENRTERDAISMTIFGKSAQDLNSLIAAGSDAMREYADEAQRTGYVQKKSSLETLAEFNDKIDQLKLKAKQAGVALSEALAPFVGYLLDNAIPKLDEFNQKLSGLFSGEVSAEEFTKYVADELQKIVEEIANNLPKMISAGMDIIAGIVSGIEESKTDLSKGLVEVISLAVEKAASALPKMVKFGTKMLLSMIQGINEKLPDMARALRDAVIESVEYLTEPETLDAIVSTTADIIVTCLQLGEEGRKAVRKLAFNIIQNLLVYFLSFDWVDELIKIMMPSSLGTEFVNGFISGVDEGKSDLKDGMKINFFGIIDNMFGNVNIFDPVSWGRALVKDFVVGTKNGKNDLKDGVEKNFFDVLKSEWEKFKDDPIQWGKDVAKNFIDGLESMRKDSEDAFYDFAMWLKDFIGFSEPKKGPLSNFHTYAPDMVDLFCKGLRDSKPQLQRQLADTLNILPSTQSYANVALARPNVAAGGTAAAAEASRNYSYGNVSINVYGAQGQSAQEIADNVLDVLQNQISGKERAFA